MDNYTRSTSIHDFPAGGSHRKNHVGAAPPTADDQAQKLSDVCSFTGIDANLCNRTLASPECAKAKCTSTTKALCTFLVNQAKSKTKEVKTVVQAGGKKNGGIISKEVVNECLGSIANATGELKTCYDSVKNITQTAITTKEVHSIWFHANSAKDYAVACGNALDSVKAEEEKETLIDANNEAKKWIDMIKASVAMFLPKGQQCAVQ